MCQQTRFRRRSRRITSRSILTGAINGSTFRTTQKFALTHSFTLEAFFYARSAPPGDARYIVHRGDDRSGNDPYWLGVGTGQVAFAFDDPTGARTFLSTPLPALNQWIHVAGTLDDATGRMSLYVNGVLQAFTTTNLRSAASLTGGSPGIGIGNTPSANFPSWFDGKIDEVRISDVALDPSQFLNAAVPEPTSAVFLGIAGLCLLSRRR